MKLILIFIFSVSCIASASNKIELRRTPNLNYGHYLKEVFDLVYSEIGYQVHYVDLPFVREIDMASKSLLSGVLARDSIIEQSAQQLVRVDVPLFSYQVILLTNSTICGKCSPEKLEIVAYPRGGKIYQNHINQLPKQVSKVAIGGTDNLITMLEIGRVDAVILSDILLPNRMQDMTHIKTQVLEQRFDYHYLSPDNRELKLPLEAALRRITANGQLSALKKKYQIK